MLHFFFAVHLYGNHSAADGKIIFSFVKLRLKLRHAFLHFLRLFDDALHIGRAAAESLGKMCFHIIFLR